jgi:hypothetical protein
VTVEHLRPALPFLPESLPTGQVDTVVSDGLTGDFEPRHTTHGFQYVRVDGYPASPPTWSRVSSCTPTCAPPGASRAATR